MNLKGLFTVNGSLITFPSAHEYAKVPALPDGFVRASLSRSRLLMTSSMKRTSLLFYLLLLTAASPVLADWPQWRGPLRNGIAPGEVDLPEEFSETTAPAKKWESETIPSDHDGGHGSVAVADGRVFLSVVWHHDEPTDTRRIDGMVLSSLGFRGTSQVPAEVVEKMETDRMNLGRRMRGPALEEWSKKWVEEHFDPKTQLSLGSWAIGRFKQGKAAIPLSVFDTLRTVNNREFAGQAEMEAWVKEQKFDPSIETRIIDAVPNTRKVANDVVMAIDAESGETLWKFETPGFPSGRAASSTPAIHARSVFAALSTHLYCLDAESGKELWRTELAGKKGPASSPLIAEGKVFLQQGRLTAFDIKTGEPAGENKDVAGANQSPAIWNGGTSPVVICNSAKEVVGVDANTMETLWTRPGGGDGTPVVSGDTLVISSRLDDKNLIAYRLIAGGEPRELFSLGFLARRYGSSPILHEGHVYHLGSDRHLCVSVETGKIVWERKASSSISSPVLADGKLFVYENRGGFLSMLRATPEDYVTLGRAKVGALFCASPAIVGNRIYLRTSGSVTCFEFP